MKTRVKFMNNLFQFRIEMIKYAKKYSISDAAFTFGLTRKTDRRVNE